MTTTGPGTPGGEREVPWDRSERQAALNIVCEMHEDANPPHNTFEASTCYNAVIALLEAGLLRRDPAPSPQQAATGLTWQERLHDVGVDVFNVVQSQRDAALARAEAAEARIAAVEALCERMALQGHPWWSHLDVVAMIHAALAAGAGEETSEADRG